ncbi:MAG: cyclic nucleotide-binding domain-containing protein [Treponema sp.]|jgi:diguanylate cyclase (GGDEF)-like protein|nr:cyclic nucleotide-binding domain-containing protein [Treponema sp.]
MGASLSSYDPLQIQKSELFSTLLDKEMDFAVSHAGMIQLRRGETLFSAGDRAAHFYMLLKGAIRIYKTGDGREEELARFTPGDAIGDFDFARNARYDANAEAVEDSVLAIFPDRGLSMEQLALEDPYIISRILLNAIVMITGRIKSTRKVIVENMSWVQELHRRAYEDPGTGLWKQTFLTDEINRILEKPTALIMLKPERFKILVDSRGHSAGDEAMVKIALILKKMSRRAGQSWPLRFKSNEVGFLINRCDPARAEQIARELRQAVAALSPVPPREGIPAFPFSAVVSWAVWPQDDPVWESLFQGNYSLLLETWRAGSGIAHYRKTAPGFA